MFYQKLLIGEKSYFVNLGSVDSYAEHRHPEAEFIYCRSGSLHFTADKKNYAVKQGELALIAPMTAHGFVNPPDPQRTVLVINVGPAILKNHFAAFTKSVFTPPVKILDDGSDNSRMLRTLLEETAALASAHDAYSELIIAGNIYKISACILREYARSGSAAQGDLRAVMNIEKALELIQSRFAEPITVEQAAAVTGYGKSNFCRIFKQIVGDTFHNVLNRRRVDIACCYLTETAMSIADITPLAGFTDSKTFCRVFKNHTGMSAGRYRTLHREKHI